MNKLLVSLALLTAFAIACASALADDKTTWSLSQNDANKPWLDRTGDFPETPAKPKMTPEEKKVKRHTLPQKGGFGPVGGRAEKDAIEQREQLEREQSAKAWAQKYGPDDQSKKAPGQ